MFEHSLKRLLGHSESQGKILQTKAFLQKGSPDQKATPQIRCYFAYKPGTGVYTTKEEWSEFLATEIGEHLDGAPSFIQMQPARQ